MFDLKNRTKNDDLRDSLNRLKCTLDAGHSNMYNTNTLDNSIKNPHLQVTNNNADYSDDQEANDMEVVDLFKVGIERLPCPEELSDPTEMPMSRESIGMDLSWRSTGVRHVAVASSVLAAVLLLTI
jgi:hypothetical protein